MSSRAGLLTKCLRRGQRRPHGSQQGTIFNVRFDSLEVQRKACKTDKDALDSTYNFFAQETLFKREG